MITAGANMIPLYLLLLTYLWKSV